MARDQTPEAATPTAMEVVDLTAVDDGVVDFAAGDPAERRGEPARAGEGGLKLEANTVPLTRKELWVRGTSRRDNR